ncbi:MAG: NAD(+) synthetase, partial [Nitrosopumilaceae archaeon]
GHFAEEELGMSYDEIDSILYCIFDKKLSLEETAKLTQIEKSTVNKVNQLYQTSQHKRITAPRPFEE